VQKLQKKKKGEWRRYTRGGGIKEFQRTKTEKWATASRDHERKGGDQKRVSVGGNSGRKKEGQEKEGRSAIGGKVPNRPKFGDKNAWIAGGRKGGRGGNGGRQS